MALRHSCNIYFYDVGRRLGVDTFSATAQQLGLGVPCGTELPETTGRLTWSTDENYQAGLALMAAIGQGNTSVSPLQLVAYAGEEPVYANMGGIVRGMLLEGTPVTKGLKSGDIDARCKVENCFTPSDKANAIAGGILEGVLYYTKLLEGK